ncbi:RHS repeat-associated core domain-containing protein [Polaribacter sp. HL-MS24]|uniref:RHS repeat domain-containing protein n=1 Tax=Polaribacter sp. HL-MS24 TaxID=3077735 RepID=UPI00293493DA|nr:RHS repeat-associated core domain-containing protein [Polaribacter sp. HL-MS24]WOC41058.1 RHS repeat-associated core domain-containing protein [Polaribacter sp. HL-MS24]
MLSENQSTENNYIYNAIGQLIENKDENVKYEYNASGLVTKVYYNNKLKVQFSYNDKGFRVLKKTYATEGTSVEKTTHYVRDVSGNTMAIYENNQQTELPIYGASRLGIYKKLSNTSLYQLTDHLGNVRAVIAKDASGNAAALTHATDYYPGGMAMPGRQIVGGQPYRYSFQGQEKDAETGKVAFQLRLYDCRINRWMTPDPYKQYASPYMAMGNSPINRIDPDGGTDCPPGETCGGSHVNQLDEIVIGGSDFSMPDFDSDLMIGFNFLNSSISVGVGARLSSMDYSNLMKTPSGSFSTTYNGGSVSWNNNFRGNSAVSGDFVKQAKLDFANNLSKGRNLTKIKGVANGLGYGLTAVSVVLDSRDYMSGEISVHRFSYRTGVNGSSFAAGYFLGAGPWSYHRNCWNGC